MTQPDSSFVLRGVLPALTTPFVEDTVSAERLTENLAWYGRNEVAGFLVLGSTGEAVLLDETERRRVLESARGAVPASLPLLAGISAESTRTAAEQIRVAAGAGIDAALVSTPHYFRAEMTHEALLAHFERLADESPIPLVLYNVPKFTGSVLPSGTVCELSRHENVAGIKESSGDLRYLRRLVDGVGGAFFVACGAAGVLPQALAMGATAAILAAAAAIPEPFTAITAASDPSGKSAETLHRRVMEARAVAGGAYGVAGIKAAMDLRGLYGGPPRSPLRPVTPEGRVAIERELRGLVRAGLLPAL